MHRFPNIKDDVEKEWKKHAFHNELDLSQNVVPVKSI